MKSVCAFVVLTAVGTANSQQTCLEINDKDKRLDCYDKALNYKTPDAPASQQPKPIPFVRFTVRDRADYTNLAGANLGSNAGQFNLQRIDGKDSSTVRLGVIPICIKKENKARSRRQCCSTARRSNAVIAF